MKLLRLLTGLLCMLLISAGPLLSGLGFGSIRKKQMNLQVRMPALYRLTDTTFAVTVSFANRTWVPTLEGLKTTVETQLIANDKTLALKETSREAQWTVSLNVTGFSLADTRDQQGNVNHRGTLDVSYRVQDSNRQVADAGNLSESYPSADNRSSFFGGIRNPLASHNVDTQDDVKQSLVLAMAGQIAARLANSPADVKVPLAGGEEHVDQASQFMSKKLWAKASSELQELKAFPKMEDESYRLYSLGLTFEGMSYEARLYKDQKANMLKASEWYDKAAEINKKQKVFVEAIGRVRDSLARYKQIDDEQQRTKARPRTIPPPPAQAGGPKSLTKTDPGTNPAAKKAVPSK